MSSVGSGKGQISVRLGMDMGIAYYNLSMTDSKGRFENAERAAAYDERIRKTIPGYDVLHQMMDVMLSAQLSDEASVLVVGAGTGQELLTLSQAHPGWRFTAIEPAKPMIEIATEKLTRTGAADRVTWFEGNAEDFPGDDVYDAVTMMMVLHFIPEENQYALLQDLADRLNPGAALVMADIFGDPETTRYKRMEAFTQAFAVRSGLDPKSVEDVFRPFPRADFYAFTEERLKGWLREAGFIDVQRFYQAFRVGAWIARTNR
jgi:tRNA (cmo5U34)-methyltransferase